MTAERLAEIRALAAVEIATFSIFDEARPNAGTIQAALRDLLGYVDELVCAEADRFRALRRNSIVEPLEPETEYDS